MTFFETTLIARFRKEEIDKMDRIINKDREKYPTRSDFVRISVIKNINEEEINVMKHSLGK